MAKDRWRDLCRLVERDDGLPTREVGPWTEDKLWFWNRYLEITTSAMVGHPKWPTGLVYVDLFGGPGVCRLRDSGRRIPGSALIAAHTPKPFTSILVTELDPALAAALEQRLASSPALGRFEVFRGDCNTRVQDVARKIPAGALTLAFIDPEGLHVRFDTVKTLSDRGRVDLLILLADRMDIVRNVDRYEAQTNSNLDQMFGAGSAWRAKWAQLANRTGEGICRLFADEYKAQLRQHLGYKVFGEKEMRSAAGPIYRIIYASKHDRGLEFWDKVTKRDRGGQLGLGF